MQETEFRGKCLNSPKGRWATGSLLSRSDGTREICEGESISKNLYRHPVCPETVGQYSGIKGGKGVKIYDGDIVAKFCRREKGADSERLSIHEITFEEGCFCAKTKYDYELCSHAATLRDVISGIQSLMREYPECDIWIEVIGNKHDNPELIKEIAVIPWHKRTEKNGN